MHLALGVSKRFNITSFIATSIRAGCLGNRPRPQGKHRAEQHQGLVQIELPLTAWTRRQFWEKTEKKSSEAGCRWAEKRGPFAPGSSDSAAASVAKRATAKYNLAIQAYLNPDSGEDRGWTRRTFLHTSATGLALTATHRYTAQAVEQGSKRVGLIGCGWYGKCDLLRLIQVSPVEVVSLCDPDKRIARRGRGNRLVAAGVREAATDVW